MTHLCQVIPSKLYIYNNWFCAIIFNDNISFNDRGEYNNIYNRRYNIIWRLCIRFSHLLHGLNVKYKLRRILMIYSILISNIQSYTFMFTDEKVKYNPSPTCYVKPDSSILKSPQNKTAWGWLIFFSNFLFLMWVDLLLKYNCKTL